MHRNYCQNIRVYVDRPINTHVLVIANDGDCEIKDVRVLVRTAEDIENLEFGCVESVPAGSTAILPSKEGNVIFLHPEISKTDPTKIALLVKFRYVSGREEGCAISFDKVQWPFLLPTSTQD